VRKVYKCKQCNYQTSIYDGSNVANSPMMYCPKCYERSGTTDIEGWADISWRNFDEDIERSIIDGSFDISFPKICTNTQKI